MHLFYRRSQGVLSFSALWESRCIIAKNRHQKEPKGQAVSFTLTWARAALLVWDFEQSLRSNGINESKVSSTNGKSYKNSCKGLLYTLQFNKTTVLAVSALLWQCRMAVFLSFDKQDPTRLPPWEKGGRARTDA